MRLHLPDDVNPEIIQLSGIKIIHLLDKTIERRNLLKVVEGATKKFYELEVGEAVISADQSSEGRYKPVTVKIKPRVTKHGAPTKTMAN